MVSRRAFLRASLQTSTLIALAPSIPGFLQQTARATQPQDDSRVLVVIELSGGNDGINTVVPFSDEGYAKWRKVLRLPTDRLLKIDKQVGLHPAMGSAAKLLESGRLAIVQGVGYPNPSRSHFKSMAIWQTANVNLPREDAVDLKGNTVYGWIGQALDADRKAGDGSPAAQFLGTGSMPTALRSRGARASAIRRLEDVVLMNKMGGTPTTAEELLPGGDLGEFVRRSTLDAYATSERVTQVLQSKDQSVNYPATGLGNQLRTVAQLLKSGVGTRVFYTSQPFNVYDTHSAQLEPHSDLLGELSNALKAFLDDLAAAKLAERVLVLCFSEFGRRVAENGSHGTDHGTAGPVFLAGPNVKAGLVGEAPKLLDLQDGDLKMGIDFRQVYASVLEDWLGLPSKPSLGADFAKLALFRS
jgi:uncharacterized protein (DUF1501 family)